MWLTKGLTRPKHASNLPQEYSSFVLKDAQHQIVPVDLKSQILLQMFWLLNSPEAGLTVWMGFFISARINSCLACNFFVILSFLNLDWTSAGRRMCLASFFPVRWRKHFLVTVLSTDMSRKPAACSYKWQSSH